MNERAITFGKSAPLSGIVTEPPRRPDENGTGLVLLNSGLLHKPGPFRLNTRLARAIAPLGLPVLRFDLSGIGDSAKHRDARPRQEQILADIDDALNQMERLFGIRRFVLMGNCTGADNAHKMAVRDQRVVGAIFMDGYAYPTPKSEALAREARKAASPRKKLGRLLAPLRRLIGGADDAPRDAREENYFWELPPKEQTEREMAAFVERDLRMLFFFSANWSSLRYPEQIAESFPGIDFGPTLEVVHFNHSQHLYPTRQEQQELIAAVTGWLGRHFPVP